MRNAKRQEFIQDVLTVALLVLLFGGMLWTGVY